MDDKIFYGWHSQDSRIEGPLNTANSVVAQYGTGGGNTPIVVHRSICIQGSMIGRAEKNGPQGSGINEEVCFTLNMIDRHAVGYEANCNLPATFSEQGFARFKSRRNLTALKSSGGDVAYGGEALIVTRTPKYIVRRLTPLECGRLQGFPDGWGGD